MIRIAVLMSAVLIVLVALSVSGCTSSTTPSTITRDYSQHYSYTFKGGLTVISQFSKSKSADNNDLYTGVFNGTSPNGTATVAIEIMPSQTAAQTTFDKVVANQMNAGCVNASALLGKSNATILNPGEVTPMGTVNSEWLGMKVQTSTFVQNT